MDNSQTTEAFNVLLSELSNHDIYWLIAEYKLRIPIPVETAPIALIKNNLVARQMVKSGRNPEYGYSLTAKGENFASWINSTALKLLLKDSEVE